MLLKTPCEICNKNDWQPIGQRMYLKSESTNYSPYIQKRFRVLFDKWFPGEESVTLTSIFCKHCGLIIYLPRPEEADIDAKYRYFDELEPDSGSITHDSSVVRGRSLDVLRYVSKQVDLNTVSRILDYGGADGRLMYDFLRIGKQCYVVDYCQDSIEGVTKLADKITDVDPGETFDLIVCSHILEHVAQPLQTLRLLASHLEPDGHIFIEVPMEVWRRAPLQVEPVTHINFFTPNSLHNFLLVSGLTIKTCELTACSYDGRKSHAIRAICRNSSHQVTASSEVELRPPDGMTMLHPGVMDTFRYHMCVPQRIPRRVLRRLKRSLISASGIQA